MIRMLLLALVASVALVACSNGTSTTSPAAGGATTTPPSTSTGTVQVANSTSYGPILADAQGNTLYLYDKDTGKTSACTGSCIAIWPALTVNGSPTAGTGVNASLLGTAQQADGSSQVTYNGHLLYLFSSDSAAGDTTGEGVEGFFVVSSAGDKVAAPMAAPSTSSSSAYHY